MDIMHILQKLRNQFKEEKGSLNLLSNILMSKRMQALLKLYESVKPEVQSDRKSLCSNSASLINEMHSHVINQQQLLNKMPPELSKLSALFLSSPHLLALLQCHDLIANSAYEPGLPELDPNEVLSQDEDESMKVVRLMKGNEPLGATIAVDELTNNIVIARILKGGAADRSGLIHVNDILVEMNNTPTHGKRPEDLISQLANFRGPLTFCLIPGEFPAASQKNTDDNEEMFVRAKVDYNPDQDYLIPCREAGLRFRKNDILCIVSRDDELWWQAAIIDDELHHNNIDRGFQQNAVRAGLVPSSRLQNRREILRSQTILSNTSDKPKVKGSSTSLSSKSDKRNAWTLLRQSFRRSKRRFDEGNFPRNRSYSDGNIQPSPPAYEEVVRSPAPALLPRQERWFRPLVLVGPQGVGRNLLKDRLIDSDPSHYAVPVPHTSRERLSGEEDGRDYHFVTREFMEDGIHQKIFLEYGEYKNNIYGTSLAAVQDVISSHQVCVLTPYPQALKLLWNPELKPFIIFVKPPDVRSSVDTRQYTHHANETKLTMDRNMSTPLSVGEMEDLANRGSKIENMYGHLFDCTITSVDIEQAFSELLRVASFVENEPLWIPKAWCEARDK